MWKYIFKAIQNDLSLSPSSVMYLLMCCVSYATEGYIYIVIFSSADSRELGPMRKIWV